MIKILKNKYLSYFVALFTLFFVNEIISNPNNNLVIFVKILFRDICLRILTFLAIIVISYHNMTLGMLLLINFIFIISVPQQVEEFSNNLPDLIDKNKILKYEKNFNSSEKSQRNKKEMDKNEKDKNEKDKNEKDKNEKDKINENNEEDNYVELDVNNYLPKKQVENKIRSPIRIKESAEIEKASKNLAEQERKERQERLKMMRKKGRKKEEFEENEDIYEEDNIEENNNNKKDFDDEGKLKKEKRIEMSSNNYEDNDNDDIDSNRKQFKDYKYEDTDDSDNKEVNVKKTNTKKKYYKKQKDRKKKRQELLKELKEMDLEEKERIENEKEIDGTIEASLKYKNYDKKLNLRMLEEDTEDESSSSSESSGSSSSSESSSESSGKEYEDVSLTEAREHVLNKLRNKIKKKYVKG